MKRIAYLMLSIVMVIILVPLIVLQGIGGGIKLNPENPKAIINFPDTAGEASQDKKEEVIFDEANGGGPKVKVYIVEEDKLEEMFLEEYIRGVVSGEMPAEFEMEALKAQAVVARTYAATRMKSYGGRGCANHKDADICTDSTHCQEWISKEDRFAAWDTVNANKYWEKITSAVDETKGLIMTYNAAPVMYPLYFSTSSGKTENSEDVFSAPYPYLTSVVSPKEEIAPKYVSNVTFTRDEFVKKFSESQYNIKLDKNKLESQVSVTGRTEGGSVKTIKVGTKTLKGTEVRGILGLNSANFSIEFGKNEVDITVLGYGHGVGMSQWGANVMAKEGNKYTDILKHYYQGTDVSSLEGAFAQEK